MKVTGIRTIRLPEHPQMLWLQVLTDEGITGLGETCLGPATVEAHLHETVAPYLIGQDPGRIAAHRRSLYDVFVGYEGTGAETRGNSATDVALWDIAGQAAGPGTPSGSTTPAPAPGTAAATRALSRPRTGPRPGIAACRRMSWGVTKISRPPSSGRASSRAICSPRACAA